VQYQSQGSSVRLASLFGAIPPGALWYLSGKGHWTSVSGWTSVTTFKIVGNHRYIQTKNQRSLFVSRARPFRKTAHHPMPVCTENLSSGVVVVKAAKDGV
jgi:hypothetical protein